MDASKLKLRKWIKPGGEVRLYVVGLDKEIRAFFVDGKIHDFPFLTVQGAASRNQKIRNEEKCGELADLFDRKWSKMLESVDSNA